MSTPDSTRSRSVFRSTRRRFIAWLTGVFALPWMHSRAAADDRSGGEDGPKHELTRSDGEIARLGADYRAQNPAEAAEIVSWIEAELPAWLGFVSPRRRARVVRERLLEASRVRREFERDEVLMLDGWVLARSEAGLAIYLDHLRSASRREA